MGMTMKSGSQALTSNTRITADEFSTVAFPRKSPRDSWRDGLQSFSVSLVLHALLLLVLLSWVVSSQLATRESLEVLTSEDSRLNPPVLFEDAPMQFSALEPPPRPLQLQDHFAERLDEQSSLLGLALPRLQDAQPVAKHGEPMERPTEKQPAETGAVDQALEKEVQQRLDREGGKSGVIRVSLLWNNGNDLDLYVQTPVGDIIAFNYKRSHCGGELDVDMNARQTESNKPVENVYWSAKQAPFGIFVVGVHEYQNHGFADPTSFLVSVKVDGEVHHFRGSTRSGKTVVNAICKFQRTADGVKFLETPETLGGNRSGEPVFK
jgi:hypothetical protein